jgi:hypothetical protein
MKKISLFTLAVAASFAGMAQMGDTNPNKAHKPLRTEMSTQPRFGLRAGVNLAKLEIDDDSQNADYDSQNKTGFFGGLFVNLPLGSSFAIQPEVNFSTQGGKVKYNTNTPPAPTNRVNDEWDFYYLNVPVMFQAKITSGLFVEAGPQVGFLLKAEDEAGRDLEDVLDMKKTEFSGALGLGYLSRIGLGINARYVMGFSNISDRDAPGNDEGKYMNRGLNLGLVYHFGAAK